MAISKRQLGSTGLEVSVLGLGTVKFGRNNKIKNKTPDGFTLPTETELSDLLSIASDNGINLIDTAPAYGTSEERLGKLLQGKREKFIISTKVGEEFDGEDSHYDFSEKHVRESVERSLKRLGTSVIESVLVHCSRDDLDNLKNSAALETLSRLKEKGDILSFGASTHTIDGGLFALEYSDTVMLPFNPEYQEHVEVIKKAEEVNKGVFIKKGLFSGHIDDENKEETIRLCFQTALEFPAVSSVVVGTIKQEHLLENVNLCQS